MLFSELGASDLPEELQESVARLLDLKMNVPELKLIPRVDKINRYIESELPNLQKQIETLPRESKKDFSELDALFVKWLEK